jgi:hypothetical protein
LNCYKEKLGNPTTISTKDRERGQEYYLEGNNRKME